MTGCRPPSATTNFVPQRPQLLATKAMVTVGQFAHLWRREGVGPGAVLMEELVLWLCVHQRRLRLRLEQICFDMNMI